MFCFEKDNSYHNKHWKGTGLYDVKLTVDGTEVDWVGNSVNFIVANQSQTIDGLTSFDQLQMTSARLGGGFSVGSNNFASAIFKDPTEDGCFYVFAKYTKIRNYTNIPLWHYNLWMQKVKF